MSDAAAQPTVWLFTRDSESVRLVVRPGPEGLQLLIFGPGEAATAFDFAEGRQLGQFCEDYRRGLIARGFRQHAAPDRRLGDGGPPPVERRR